MFCKNKKIFTLKDGSSIDVEKHMQVNGVAGNFLGSNEKKVNNQKSWKNKKVLKILNSFWFLNKHHHGYLRENCGHRERNCENSEKQG